MTNTMHRQGCCQSLNKDWVIFTHSAAGYNKKGSGPLHKKFAEICLKHRPSNMGIGEFNRNKTNLVKELLKDRSESTLYKNGDATEEQINNWKQTIEKMGEEHAYFVFSHADRIQSAIKEVKEADLGVCVCINALYEESDVLLREVGIIRHTVQHSLGFHGDKRKLPSDDVLEISTMCGHGMVSYNLTKTMIENVRQGKMTPERAGEYLMKTCSCGIFNPVRAADIIKQNINGYETQGQE